MLLHIDSATFRAKPSGPEVGGIKYRFTKPASIQDLTTEQIASALASGQTIQPGVTPFSDASKAKGRKGTVKEDFTEQTLFMVDIDNKANGPIETVDHVQEVLAAHNLRPAFMYPTFGSTPDAPRFRVALVSDTPFTDKTERDRVQAGLIALFPQADADCVNADRIFFGTDKGMSYTNFQATCAASALLSIAASQPTVPAWPKYGSTIPAGQRHGTLLSFALTVLKKYGVSDRAHEAFMSRVAQCEEPKPNEEVTRIWRDACEYYERTIATASDYIPPSEYAARDFAESLQPTDYTDLGQARVFVSQYGSISRYSAATKWLVYDGKKWNESELKAQGLAQELTDRQLEEVRDMLDEAQEAEEEAEEAGDKEAAKRASALAQLAKRYRTFVLARRKSSQIASTLTEARPPLEVDVKELDADGYLLNTPGGTVDLRTGELRPHDANDFCTKMTSVAPGTENANIFAGFMERVTVGDKDLARYLQEIAGMCAVGKVLRENMIIAYGGGGNGKSTLFNLLARVLGDYSGTLSAETLTSNCKKNKSPEFAELRGKRLIIAAELEEGMRLDTSTVKQLCSTDPITAEKKYRDPFSFVPSHTVILYTNHLPKVGTNDKGTWDRIIAVPFNAKFRGMKGEILNYADYLFEHCGGAVLSWIIEGAKRFIDNHYYITLPDCVKAAIEQYKETNNWLDNFLCECCEIDRSYTQKSGELYEHYRNFCDRTGDYRRSLVDFKQALDGAGFETRKTMLGAIIYGLRVRVSEPGFTRVDADDILS